MKNPAENLESRPKPEMYIPQEREKPEAVITPEEIATRGRRELNALDTEGQRGLHSLESSSHAMGLSETEISGYMQSHSIPGQIEAIRSQGRGLFAKLSKRIETAAAIGVAAVVMGQAPTVEARPVFVKDNPQREAYKDYDSYQKYVESMRDVKAEEESAKLEEKFHKSYIEYMEKLEIEKKLRESYLRNAEIAKQRKDKELDETWVKIIGMSDALIKTYSEGAEYWKDMEDSQKAHNPKRLYESAKALTPEGFQAKAAVVNKAFETADEQRAWMAKVVSSESYRKKAQEFERLTQDEINRRIEILANTDAKIADQFHTLAKSKTGSEVLGQYSSGSYTVSPDEQAAGEPVAVHEMEHAITDTQKNMSEYAKDLYIKFYAGPDPFTAEGKYLSDPTEIDARKRVFEYDMEKNGAWKYGETFTVDHMLKAFDLYKEGKLSENSMEFMNIVKPENIPMIINTIAKENSSKNRADASLSA